MTDENTDDFEQESFDFDDLESADGEQEYPETFALSNLLADGDMVAGTIRNIDKDVGKYNSTVYAIQVRNSELSNHDESDIVDDESVIQLWGNGSVDAKIESAKLDVGDTVAIKRDGTYENKHGEFDNYVVRFRKFD